MALDYLVWDGVETVTLERPRRFPADVAPLSEFILPVSVAKRRAINTRERMASGGAYIGSDANWFIPTAVLPQGQTCLTGDVVTDAAGRRWTALEVQLGKINQTWKLTSRQLALHFALSDEIDIQRPATNYDAAGVLVATYLPDTDDQVYSRVLARVTPLRKEIVEERGIRGFQAVFDVVVERELDIGDRDRIYWPATGKYLDILGYRQAERIDELPVIEAVLKP